MIQRYVQRLMNVDIPPQNQGDLQNLMRGVYQQNPSLSLRDMNDSVVQAAFKIIEPNVKMNLHYQATSGNIPPPMPLPVSVSTTGLRSGEVKIGISQ